MPKYKKIKSTRGSKAMNTHLTNKLQKMIEEAIADEALTLDEDVWIIIDEYGDDAWAVNLTGSEETFANDEGVMEELHDRIIRYARASLLFDVTEGDEPYERDNGEIGLDFIVEFANKDVKSVKGSDTMVDESLLTEKTKSLMGIKAEKSARTYSIGQIYVAKKTVKSLDNIFYGTIGIYRYPMSFQSFKGIAVDAKNFLEAVNHYQSSYSRLIAQKGEIAEALKAAFEVAGDVDYIAFVSD